VTSQTDHPVIHRLHHASIGARRTSTKWRNTKSEFHYILIQFLIY
jgi:hypothetical protein